LVLTRATEEKMTNINGVHNAAVPAVSQIGPASSASAATAPAQTTAVQDTVEISTVARLAAQVQELPPVRAEVVQRVKAELAAGTYETPDKIDVAIDRLMDELF
jgi:negative regulator of flagellin synthesis FlgM